MSEDPPNLLDYQRQLGRRRRRHRRQSNPHELWTGLAVGFAASVFFWAVLANVRALQNIPFLLIISFITVKVTSGLALTASRGWNHFGKGLLLSIGLIGLITLGVCGIALSR